MLVADRTNLSSLLPRGLATVIRGILSARGCPVESFRYCMETLPTNKSIASFRSFSLNQILILIPFQDPIRLSGKTQRMHEDNIGADSSSPAGCLAYVVQRGRVIDHDADAVLALT